MACSITGTAVIRNIEDPKTGEWIIEWRQTDPEIHVHTELISNAKVLAHLEERYKVGEHCPHDPFTLHARLLELELEDNT